MYHGFHKNIKQYNEIRMISEGSSDTEDWRNGYWKFSFDITINYIKNIININVQL